MDLYVFLNWLSCHMDTYAFHLMCHAHQCHTVRVGYEKLLQKESGELIEIRESFAKKGESPQGFPCTTKDGSVIQLSENESKYSESPI